MHSERGIKSEDALAQMLIDASQRVGWTGQAPDRGLSKKRQSRSDGLGCAGDVQEVAVVIRREGN